MGTTGIATGAAPLGVALLICSLLLPVIRAVPVKLLSMTPTTESGLSEAQCGAELWVPEANDGAGGCSTGLGEKMFAANMLLGIKHCERTGLSLPPSPPHTTLPHTHTHMQSPRPNMLRAPNTKFLTHSRHATNCSRSHRGPIRSPPLHFRHPPSLYHPTFAAVNERNAKYVAAFGQLAGCDKTLSITTIDSGHNVRVFPNLLCALNWGVPSISPQQRPNSVHATPQQLGRLVGEATG